MVPTDTQDVSYKTIVASLLFFLFFFLNVDQLLRYLYQVIFLHELLSKSLLVLCCLFQANISFESRGIFYLDAPSASVCLLIQLERHVTEEGGVSPSVYSRKEPVCECSSTPVT